MTSRLEGVVAYAERAGGCKTPPALGSILLTVTTSEYVRGPISISDTCLLQWRSGPSSQRDAGRRCPLRRLNDVNLNIFLLLKIDGLSKPADPPPAHKDCLKATAGLALVL